MLLAKYRYFCSHAPSNGNFLSTRVQRNFSFQTLTKTMEVRKKFFKKIKDHNRKLTLQMFPFYRRFYETVKEHKKKTAFFIVVLGLMAYFETYSRIVRYVRTMEPLRLKMRRWFLGEEKIMPDSIKELFIVEEGLKLKPETINVLSELFSKTDKELAYGVTRKLLKKVYVKANCLPTKKDKEDFYNEGPYRRKINQRLNGLSLKLYLLQFERMLKKMQKKDPTYTEEDLLSKVVESWEEARLKTLQWEEKILKIRPELRKAGTMFEDDKKRVIWEKVKEDPNMSLADIDKALVNLGFYGLSLKEKLLVIEYQLMYLNVIKNYYSNKLANEVIPTKTIKRENKIKSIEERIQKHQALLELYKKDFKEIFQKPKKPEEVEPVKTDEEIVVNFEFSDSPPPV